MCNENKLMTSKTITCKHLLCALDLMHLMNDAHTCRLLSTNGFTTVFALKGIHKKTLRNMGIKHGHANEIVNAVKTFFLPTDQKAHNADTATHE